jgi:hypothetical protein
MRGVEWKGMSMFSYDDYPFRVFISYSRQNYALAEKLANRLRELKFEPVWDKTNPPGLPFLEEIKKQIAHAHLFIPLLTHESGHSNWVNHEIGYAMGRNVPVLPLSLGKLPEGMVAAVQAEIADKVEDLFPRLTRIRINQLVRSAQTIAVYECADLVEARTDAIINHCKEIETFSAEQAQPIRHQAAFGSFSLPSNPRDPLWNSRYNGLAQGRTQHRITQLSQERTLLEEYALRFGCDLILYPNLSHLSKIATETRIQILKKFLQKMLDARANARVVFDESALGQNLLIVGDWFSAESITPQREGYRHTTITCHAPTVLKQLEEFDMQFRGYPDRMSADRAILWLDEFLGAL